MYVDVQGVLLCLRSMTGESFAMEIGMHICYNSSMKLSEDKRDIFHNVIAGGILIHYGAIFANVVFFSSNGYGGSAFNLILIIVWIVFAIRATR